MAALSALYPEVLPHVHGCTMPMVDSAIIKVVADFFNRSRAYRLVSEGIPVVAGAGNYSIDDLPSKTAIAWLLAAELDGLPLDIKDSSAIPISWDTDQGAPSAAVVFSNTEIGLRKVPDSSGGVLRVRLALRPLFTATTYPDEFHNLYQEHIAAGVLAKLYAQPNKSWSAPGLVRDCRDKFEAGITEAEYRADRGSSNSNPRTALCLIGGR